MDWTNHLLSTQMPMMLSWSWYMKCDFYSYFTWYYEATSRWSSKKKKCANNIYRMRWTTHVSWTQRTHCIYIVEMTFYKSIFEWNGTYWIQVTGSQKKLTYWNYYTYWYVSGSTLIYRKKWKRTQCAQTKICGSHKDSRLSKSWFYYAYFKVKYWVSPRDLRVL